MIYLFEEENVMFELEKHENIINNRVYRLSKIQFSFNRKGLHRKVGSLIFLILLKGIESLPQTCI